MSDAELFATHGFARNHRFVISQSDQYLTMTHGMSTMSPALALEQSEEWVSGLRSLDMSLRETPVADRSVTPLTAAD